MTSEIKTGIAFLVVAAVYLGVRSDRMANRAIQAGNSSAFNTRVRILMQEHNYSEEKAKAAVQRVKDSNKKYGSVLVKLTPSS
jgi:phosphopantetheine adenylyltransferase